MNLRLLAGTLSEKEASKFFQQPKLLQRFEEESIDYWLTGFFLNNSEIPLKFHKEPCNQNIRTDGTVPLRLKKAGMVLCGGARETHCATYNNGVTPSKTKEFLKSPCFFRS